MNGHEQNVLAAGGAPWCWQREMKKGVARLDALPRASVWIRQFVSMLMGLHQEGLFGACLASMLIETERTARAETDAARRSRPRFIGPVEAEAGERQADDNEPAPFTKRAANFSLSTHEAKSSLNELPRQAAYELLRRLADVLPASGGTRTQHSRPATSRANAPEPARLPSGLHRESREASQRNWQDELVRRIKRVISLAEQPRMDAAEPARMDAAEPEHDLLVWSTPLSGPTAPSELLGYLRNLPRRDRVVSNDNRPRRAAAHSLSKEQKKGAREELRSLTSTNSQPRANSTTDGSWPDDWSREISASFSNPASAGGEGMMPSTRARENRRGAGDGQAATDDPAAHTRQRTFSSTAEGLRLSHPAQVKPSWSEYWEPLRPPEDNFDPQMEDDPSTSGWARQIEPPTTAPQLPPLVPPQMVGMPVLPVAAATARHGARAEETADEDLDVLAARIKRILDEEARRHGIDV